ncbi:MAG TPA: sulfite oxidase [Actinobacteria bacterium]|jgi:DMSO/TMAO reductase YedYZ molybdopterin-dependent catalytic subunit|nr:sulfite oxidase [Actinomycetota bacterium]
MPRAAGRRTNLALFGLLAVVLATGGAAFALGDGWVRWVVVAHGAAGLGLLVLAPWKRVIVRRGMRREREATGASVVFGVLVVIAVAAGIGHATGVLRSIGGFTAMQLHVTAALASIPFLAWHVRTRPVRPRRTDLSRRALLRAGAVAGGSFAAWGALTGLVTVAGLPGRRRRLTGSYQQGTGRPAAMPVTQWLRDGVPAVDPTAWRVVVAGPGMARPVARSLTELEAIREPVRALLDCTGGWYAEQTWEGVRLDRLLGEATSGARSILVRSVTGYTRRFPVADASKLWLATRASGAPLSTGHGAPARLVVPARRGFWWVKWVVAVEAGHTPWWWQPPFPLQ